AVNTSLRRRLAARSMAFALGRSIVTSRIVPSVAVLMPSDMSRFLQADQRIDRHRAQAARPHDDGIQVELRQALEAGVSVARAGKRRLHQRADVAGRTPAVATEQARHAQ